MTLLIVSGVRAKYILLHGDLQKAFGKHYMILAKHLKEYFKIANSEMCSKTTKIGKQDNMKVLHTLKAFKVEKHP